MFWPVRSINCWLTRSADSPIEKADIDLHPCLDDGPPQRPFGPAGGTVTPARLRVSQPGKAVVEEVQAVTDEPGNLVGQPARVRRKASNALPAGGQTLGRALGEVLRKNVERPCGRVTPQARGDLRAQLDSPLRQFTPRLGLRLLDS